MVVLFDNFALFNVVACAEDMKKIAERGERMFKCVFLVFLWTNKVFFSNCCRQNYVRDPPKRMTSGDGQMCDPASSFVMKSLISVDRSC